jgi:hypothetical protein
MNHELSRLYQRICDYSPDDAESAFTFTHRLAYENGWNLPYARRVVEEYKKFMFLAVTAGHAVTPSDEVDQAWHLHLIYTRSYWDDFCGHVLETPIHHGPTKGGSEEQQKFLDLYDETKASYERLLNESPPPDIWPDTACRFGDDVHYVRVNSRDHWVIPKQRACRYAVAAVAALVLVAATCGFYRSHALHSERSPVTIDNSMHPTDTPSSAFIRSAIWTGPTSNDPRLIRFQAASQRTPQQNRGQKFGLVIGLVIGMIALASVILVALFNGKCSGCGRTRAMKKTGNSERGTGWFAATKDEWKCQHCGATLWTTHYAGCGDGGSGCGGTTHCGDSGCGASGCGGGGCGGGGCGGGGCGGG